MLLQTCEIPFQILEHHYNMSQLRPGMRLSGFNVLFQFLVKLVKVDCKGLGSGRSEVLFRVNREVRVVPFVCKERRDTSGSTRGVIVSEFRKWK